MTNTADHSFDLAPAPRGGGQSIRKTKEMQNKPNLCLFQAVSGDYEEKQTQSNPIQSHFSYQKPLSKPKQTQFKPNQTQFLRATPQLHPMRVTPPNTAC